ncbi:PKD domain-containing protein [Flavobacterium pectinovorum]|uniref:Leucine-rich repeat (LRR) protein n=1 Tax=Flavobacterium pectinovorum TaxID=29533 RepID=A0AB36P0K0_9FLAO|nr:PKD domain-containing protein [Flavobacterium pectinovorum]OXB04032.1 hypothetical protein B0A72_14210 [Flavobacterium pectinovorum]SHN09550.1 Leucine-rich repeat (LRR) protein [Flavobacterium pectinovorum]
MKLKYTLVFTIISFFITTVGFTQTYSDQEIGFDAARFTTSLKEHGVSDQDIPFEITRLRNMKLIRYTQIKKEEQASLIQKLKTQQSSKSSTSKLAADEVTDISAAEKAVLKTLYDNHGGTNWSNRSGWDFSTPVTSWNSQTQTGWYGITVVNGHVEGINMVRQNITGILPDLTPLSYLKQLHLGYNNLNPQNFPSWITNLNNLEQLSLGGCNLNGAFPNLSSLQKLTHLTLSQNPFDVSVMPSWFTQLPNLFSLEVYDCKFKGPIPDLSSLNKLRYLSIGFSDFSNETIPLWLNNMPQLFDLDISVSKLKGEIPDLSNLTSLLYFDFSYNQLTGPIPNYFNNFPNLNYISLYNNNLTGPIPEVSNLKNLRQLSFANNQIAGNIPDLSGATNLRSIDFSNNKLTGTIPDLSNLDLTYLRLNSNQLSGPIPNLKPTPSLGYLEMGNNQLTGTLPDLSLFTGLYGIDFSFNKLTGSVPSYSSITNLNTLRLDNNQLSGNIPSLTSNTALTFVSINHNKFRFVDFVDQFTFLNARSFGHSPQAPIDIPQTFDKKTGESVTFKMCMDDILHPGDTFQWFRNGQKIIEATGQTYTIDNLSIGLSGTYTCLSYHDLPGMKLALSREPITLNVTCADIVGNIKMDKEENEVDTTINFSFETTSTNLIYYWNFYNSNDINVFHAETINATPSFSVPGMYKLELTIMDPGNSSCRIDLEKFFTITPKPCVPLSGAITTSTQNIFPNTSVLFSFDRTLENSTYEWTFYNLDKTSSTTYTSSSYRYVYTAIGNYEVNLKITDKYGCSTNFVKPIAVTQKPPCVSIVGTMLPAEDKFLTNSNITFSLNTSSSNFGYNWSFSKPDGSYDSSNDASVTKSFSETGNYTIVLLAVDIYGCITRFERTITISKAGCVPIAGNITTSTPDVFVGTSTNFSLETTATNLSYKWTFTQDSESTIFTTKTVDYTYIRPGTNNVTLEVTDSNGCKTTFQKLVSLKTGSSLCDNVTQFGRAYVQVGSNTDLFKAATITVNQTTNVTFPIQSYGPAFDFEYKWSLLNENDQLVDSGTSLNFPIMPTSGGFYRVVLDLKENTSGCVHQFTRAIICTIPNSCAQTNPQSTTVKGLVVNLLKNLMSRAIMGESDVQINSSAVTAEFNALKPYITSGPKDKIYNFTSTRSLNGEFTSVDFSFSPDRVSDVHISVPHGLIYSQGMPLEYLQSSMIEPRLYIDLSQYTSANQYLISCLSDGTGKSLLKPNDCQYGSEIRYIDFCPNECDPLLGVVKVSTEKPTLNTAINFSLETAATGLTYNWTFYNADNTVKGNQTSAIGSQTYTAPGNYKIVLIATDSNNCNTTITKNINIAAPSCVAATGTIKTVSPNIFAGTTTNFFFDTTATNLTYQWTLYRNVNYSVETSTTNNANMYYDVPGSYNVKLVVTDTNGCTNTFRTTAVVTVKPPCVTVAGDIKTASPIIYTNENTTYSFDTTATNLTYNWTFHSLNNTPLGTATTSTASVVYPYAGNYVVTLVIVDENNCATTINKNVTVQVKHICTEIAGSIKASTEKIKTNNNTVFSLQTTATNITYKWIFYNTNSVEIGTATTSTAEWVYTTPGDYLVALEITDQYACKTKLYKTVKVTEPVPCTPLVGTIKMDTDTPFLYTYATFTFETTATDLTYTWNVKIPEDGGYYNNPLGGNPFQLYLQYGEGEYTILLDVKDSNDCVTHFEKKITPIYDCRTNSLTGIIFNRTHPNYYSPKVLINKPNEFTFWPYSVWNLDDLTLNWELTKMDDTLITSFTGEIFVFTPTTSDNLKLKLTITDRNNCPHYFDRELEVTEACEFSEETIDGFIGFQSEDNTEILTTKINEAKMLLFNATKEIERNYSYKWQVYNSSEQLLSSGTENNHQLTLTNPGFYKVTLDLENEYGCIKKFSKTINCLIENSCTYENPKSEIVKKVFVNFVKNLIVRSLKGETDAQINSFGTRTGFTALRAYITNGTKNNIYNYSTSRDEKGKLTTIMFSFSPETEYDVKIYVKKGIWDYEQIADGTTNEFASKIESEIYLNLEQFISPDDYLVSCFNQKPQNSTVTKFVPEPNDCLLSSEIRHIDFCPAEACLPTIGIIRTGTSITYPPQFDKSSKQTK